MSNAYSDAMKIAEQAYERGNTAEAVTLFTALAEGGVREACQFLGFIYGADEGEFSNKDQSGFWYSKYLLLLRRASEAGDLEAMLSLGKHYQYGDIVGDNAVKARSLILRAAELGLADAQYHLANLYFYGWCGFEQDEAAFLKWLDRAADSSQPEAVFRKGSYLIQNPATQEYGLELIRRSAKLGFWMAQQFLETRGERA